MACQSSEATSRIDFPKHEEIMHHTSAANLGQSKSSGVRQRGSIVQVWEGYSQEDREENEEGREARGVL